MSSTGKSKIFDPANPYFRWLILFNVIVTTFMALLSTTITIIANSSIQGELALSDPRAAWVTTFYLLGVNSTVPAATWIAARFGFRTTYAVGALIFALGSGCAGFAWDFYSIGITRFVEGIGAGLILPVGLAMISRNFPKEQLGTALILYIAIGFGGGLGFGLPIAGYFAEFHSWRDVFFIILPLGILAAIDCWLVHEETPQQSDKPFDYPGYFFFILFISSLLVALSFGALPSTDEGWTSFFILSCFATAIVSLALTILIESRSNHPIIPLQLFQNPVFAVSALALFLLGMALFSSISSMADFMLNVLVYDKFRVGLIAMVYGLSMAGGSVLSSLFMRWIPTPFLTLSGLTLLVVSYFLHNEITVQSYPGQISLILFLRGMGVGLALGPVTTLGMGAVQKELAGDAATLLTFFRQVGGTYGGTIITIMVIKRKIFHVARFSETVNPQNPGYRYTWQKLYDKFSAVVSDNRLISAKQAKISIAETIELQAYTQSINDAMVVFGCITIVLAIVITYLNIRRYRQAA